MPDYTLLPAVEPLDPDGALAAAEAAALTEPDELDTPVERPQPFGRSWAFDFSTGQFIRHGAAPAETFGLETLKQWAQNALLTRRFAHLIYSDAFGLELDDDLIGSALTPITQADYTAAVVEALLVHDRIASVDDFTFTHDPDEDFVVVNFTITTDADDKLEVAQVPLLTGGAS